MCLNWECSPKSELITLKVLLKGESVYREIFMKRTLCDQERSLTLWMVVVSQVITNKELESFQLGGFVLSWVQERSPTPIC